MELTLRMTESFSTFVSRESVTIDTDYYPELQGKTEDEIQDYIKENAWEMPAPEGCDWADNLSDYLSQQDVVREKNTGEEYEIYFE